MKRISEKKGGLSILKYEFFLLIPMILVLVWLIRWFAMNYNKVETPETSKPVLTEEFVEKFNLPKNVDWYETI